MPKKKINERVQIHYTQIFSATQSCSLMYVCECECEWVQTLYRMWYKAKKKKKIAKPYERVAALEFNLHDNKPPNVWMIIGSDSIRSGMPIWIMHEMC